MKCCLRKASLLAVAWEKPPKQMPQWTFFKHQLRWLLFQYLFLYILLYDWGSRLKLADHGSYTVPQLNLLTPLLLLMIKFGRGPVTCLISVVFKGLTLYLLVAVFCCKPLAVVNGLLRRFQQESSWQKLITAKGLVCKRLNRTLQYLQLLLSETGSRCSSNWGYYLVWRTQPQASVFHISLNMAFPRWWNMLNPPLLLSISHVLFSCSALALISLKFPATCTTP